MTPYLYIIMRVDLQSMNAGKAVAQGAHAANCCQHAMDRLSHSFNGAATVPKVVNAWREWQASTPQNFGTTITLEADENQLKEVIAKAQEANFPSAVIHDPTYPLVDGSVVHLLPLDTCGYVFGYKEELFPILGHLKLMGLCGAANHKRSHS